MKRQAHTPVYRSKDLVVSDDDFLGMMTRDEKIKIMKQLMGDLRTFLRCYEHRTTLTTTTISNFTKMNDEKHVIRLVRDASRNLAFEWHAFWQSALEGRRAVCEELFTVLCRQVLSFHTLSMNETQRLSPIKMQFAGLSYTLYFRLCTCCMRFIFFCAPSTFTTEDFRPNAAFERVKENELGMADCAHNFYLNYEHAFDRALAGVPLSCPKRAKVAAPEPTLQGPQPVRTPVRSKAPPAPVAEELEERAADTAPRAVARTTAEAAIVKIAIVETDAPMEVGGAAESSEEPMYSILTDCTLNDDGGLFYGAHLPDQLAYLDSHDLENYASYMWECHQSNCVPSFSFLKPVEADC